MTMRDSMLEDKGEGGLSDWCPGDIGLAESRLEQIDRRIQVEEVVAEIGIKSFVPIASQFGLQTVIGGAHREMLHDPIFETGVELKHRACVIAD